MLVDRPHVLEDSVHGAAVVELGLKLHRLARHLDGHEDIEQSLADVGHERMGHKQLLAVVTGTEKSNIG